MHNPGGVDRPSFITMVMPSRVTRSSTIRNTEMAEKGLLEIKFKEHGKPLLMVVESPLPADETTVLLYILSAYEGKQIGIDVDWTTRDSERLLPQISALGITDVTWSK